MLQTRNPKLIFRSVCQSNYKNRKQGNNKDLTLTENTETVNFTITVTKQRKKRIKIVGGSKKYKTIALMNLVRLKE